MLKIEFNPFPNKPWFSRFETSNFSFFHTVFNPSGEVSAIFIKFKIVVYKVFGIGRV